MPKIARIPESRDEGTHLKRSFGDHVARQESEIGKNRFTTGRNPEKLDIIQFVLDEGRMAHTGRAWLIQFRRMAHTGYYAWLIQVRRMAHTGQECGPYRSYMAHTGQEYSTYRSCMAHTGEDYGPYTFGAWRIQVVH